MRNVTQKRCKACKRAFTPKPQGAHHARYCSDRCRAAAYRERRRQAEDRPAPTPRGASRRWPLPDAAFDAGKKLRKAVEGVERILTDDRFAANRMQVRSQLRFPLSEATQDCDRMLGELGFDREGRHVWIDPERGSER